MKKPKSTTFGQRLKAARIEKRLSRPAVARLVRVSEKTIMRWEADESEPSELNRPALVAAFPSLGGGS